LAGAGAGIKSIKVVDFGLAKRIDAAHELNLTGPRESLGSPCYMSPEQITVPQEVDARTDIWSLGVTLYRLLTGVLPFPGDTMAEVYARVLNTEPRPLYSVRRGLDAELDAIVKGCLQKDVSLRYQTVGELSEAIVAYRRRHRKSLSRSSGTALAVYVDDSAVEIPMRGPGRGTLAFLFVATLAGLALYEADRTGRVDTRQVVARALEPVLANDQIRRFADGWLMVPALGATPDVPIHVELPVPTTAFPAGVCSLSAAFDSSGRTLAAEVERGSPEEDET